MFLSSLSPAEELYFGSAESGEKKTLIVLTNVTKNVVAFKVPFWKISYVWKFDMGSDFRHFHWKVGHFELVQWFHL